MEGQNNWEPQDNPGWVNRHAIPQGQQMINLRNDWVDFTVGFTHLSCGETICRILWVTTNTSLHILNHWSELPWYQESRMHSSVQRISMHVIFHWWVKNCGECFFTGKSKTRGMFSRNSESRRGTSYPIIFLVLQRKNIRAFAVT